MAVNDPMIWQAARQKLPLPLLMSALGDGAFTKKGAACPFCGAEKGKWAIFERSGKHFFKCHSPNCVANENEAGHGEIAYIMLRKDMNAKDAGKEYLKIAVPEMVPYLFDPIQTTGGSAGPKSEKPIDPNAEADDDEIPGIPSPPKQAPPPPPPPPRDGEAKNPWHAFWKKIPLTAEDRLKLRRDRGFTDETIDALGFRSNNASNLHHLQQLASEFSMDALIAEGIFKEEGSRGVRPSGQLQGWGRTDKIDPKSNKHIYEQTEPIIIPYLDEEGVPFYLRPHKGGVKKPVDDLHDIELWEDDEGQTCAAHVFCPFLLVELIHLNDGLCVLTEGEYKAAALWQCGIAALACPGIQFVRNRAFREELVQVLRKFGVSDLVVIFDNEVKDDPKFPKRYKPDPWKRWDTPMWAEYTAIALRDYFNSVRGTCRIGWLPDELRIDGKADCDGVLAQMVQRHGLEEGTQSARRVFLKTIEEASEKPGLEIFPSEGRRIIECKLERLFYTPLVYIAGEKEMTLSRRFSEYNTFTGYPVNKRLAELFRNLRGCYYKRAKPVKDEIVGLNKQKAELDKEIAELKEQKSDQPNWEKQRRYKLRIAYANLAAVWEQLKGLPEPLSNFTLSCEYKLHTTGGDVHRLVHVKDSKAQRARANGTSALRRLAPKDLARLSDFRGWLYATGEGVWHGGDKDLQHLVQDMDHHSFLRDIHEITTYGYHPESQIWFFGDVAFDRNGKVIKPDASNIFWHDGIGYQIEQSASERGTNFVQGAPLLLTPQGPVEPIENPDIAAMFRQFSDDLFQTVGGFDGWMIIGLMCGYAIAPELIRAGGHPGLWLFGKMSSGKTTVARWAMRMWGFKELGGIRMGESTSATAMNRFLAQYNSLPVWIDEYRRLSVDAQREEVLRGAFDRSSGAKGVADHSTKTRNATILTTPVVSGESSSGDAATRSRYGHVSVSAHRRLGDGVARFARVQNEAQHFYQIGFWLMENRKTFADRAMFMLNDWMKDQTVRKQIVNERVRLVHGVAFSCFWAMAEMLGLEKSIEVAEPGDSDLNPTRTRVSLASARMVEYQMYLFQHGAQALADVIEETFLNQFWRDLISGIQLSKIPAKFFVMRYVKFGEHGKLLTCHAEDHDAFHVVYIAADAVFAAYQQFKAGRREDSPQGVSDIRREMEKEPYWIPAPKGGDVRVHRINVDGHKTSCWVITLERKEGEGGKVGPHLFSMAEDLESALTKEPDPDAEGA